MILCVSNIIIMHNIDFFCLDRIGPRSDMQCLIKLTLDNIKLEGQIIGQEKTSQRTVRHTYLPLTSFIPSPYSPVLQFNRPPG